MKRIFPALVLILGISLFACRKTKVEPDIYTYDQQQIQAYISANGISGMQKDTTGHSLGQDTTGIWYQIITSGKGAPIDYPDEISYVYTIRSFDGSYNSMDTVTNHYDGLLGHTAPKGLVLAIRNILRNKGTKARILIPSHLAYGLNGAGSGSKTLTNGRIAGNECLDYTVNIVDNQAAYDDMVIQNYMQANNLSGFTQTSDGLWYKITRQPTGQNYINLNSAVTANYEGRLMDNSFFDDTFASTSTYTFSDLATLTTGFREGLLLLGRGGGSMTLLIPSRLAYGNVSQSGSLETVPADACLRFDLTVTGVVSN